MDAFEQCKEQSNVTEFLNLLQSVTSQAWLVIYSLYRDIKKEGLTREIVQCSGFGTIEIEAAGDSNKSRRVNLVLQYLTVALKLIEPEETLMDMLNKATLKAPILDMVESAHEELIFLRAFLMDVLRQQMKLNKYHHILRNVEETANKLAQVNRLRSLGCITSQHIEGLINFLSNRLDIVLDCDAGSISFLMNRSRVLKVKLMYLGYFVADVVQHYNMHQGLNDLMKHVLDTKYVCLLSVGGYKSAWYYMLYLSDMKQLLKFVETEVKTIIPKAPESSSYSFPKTNGLGFLQFFLGNLEELLCSKLDSVIDWNHQIGSVKEGILCLRDHFTENFDELDEVYGFVLKVTEMAYKAEFVIDSCLVSSHPLWYISHRMSEVVKNIKLLNKVVTETYGRKERDVTVHKVAKTSISLYAKRR
ncbi:hypothetical protein KY285_023206 [Solanum tuberosum]|nr:hypothetical protein KY284_023304 [Solanum tuberosum]KAH0675405.1 hypothetical protein KY285_023206 [Solanum tuberosum]